LIGLVNGHQRPINRWLGHVFCRESFACSKCLILSKGNEERYFKRTSLPNALSKETLGQTLANLLRVHPWTSIVISFSSRENSSSFFLYKETD